MEKLALFLDLDGTLLDDEKNISEANYKAIHRVLSMGHYVIISTGRPLISALNQAARLGLSGEGCLVIAFNGCVIYDIFKNTTLFRAEIPLEIVRMVFSEARKRGLYIQTYEKDSVVVEKTSNLELLDWYCGRIGIDRKLISSTDELTQDPEKMLVIHMDDPEALKSFQSWIANLPDSPLDSFSSGDSLLEIVSKGTNKGTALIQTAKILGVSMENTYAAGDSPNDIEMLQIAKHGFAMKNADPCVKDAANFITENDNNHDGIAEIINKYILPVQ